MSSLDGRILMYSGINTLDLITKFQEFIAKWCFHNNFTTIKQHDIMTIIAIHISKGFT